MERKLSKELVSIQEHTDQAKFKIRPLKTSLHTSKIHFQPNPTKQIHKSGQWSLVTKSEENKWTKIKQPVLKKQLPVQFLAASPEIKNKEWTAYTDQD